MATSKVNLDQLDEFKDVLSAIQNRDFVRWDDTIKKFVPVRLGLEAFPEFILSNDLCLVFSNDNCFVFPN